MFQFALIINVPGASLGTCSKVYENKESHNEFIGSGSMDMAALIVKSLADQGIEEIDLCGAFDDQETKRLIDIAQSKIEIFNAKYSPEENCKVKEMTSFKKYGFISITKGIQAMHSIELPGEKRSNHIVLVKDLDMACQAANMLLGDGVDLIELCSWFDNDKTQKVISSIDGKLPVGSCGLVVPEN